MLPPDLSIENVKQIECVDTLNISAIQVGSHDYLQMQEVSHNDKPRGELSPDSTAPLVCRQALAGRCLP